MKRFLILLVLLGTAFHFQIKAQSSQAFPDKIIMADTRILNCRIQSIDSVKINCIIHSLDRDVSTYVKLESIVSYIYKGKKVVLQSIPEPESALEEVLEANSRDSTLQISESRQREDEKSRQVQLYEGKKDWHRTGNQLHVENQPGYVFRLSLLPPALVLEKKITNTFTIVGRGEVGLVYSWGEYNGSQYSDLILIPSVMVSPRTYLKMDSRISRGKRVDYFSGEYIGFPLTVTLTGSGLYTTAGVVGGFQRTLGKRGYWNISLGPGLLAQPGYGTSLTILGEFNIGFILSK